MKAFVHWSSGLSPLSGRQSPRALVADDEPNARGLLTSLLGAAGYEVVTAAGIAEAIDVLEGFAPHLVLADVELSDGDRPLIAAVTEHAEPHAALILLARRELVPAAIRGLAAGADGYLTKPIEAEHLRLVAERLIDHCSLRARVDTMRARLSAHRGLRRLVGESQQIHGVRDALSQAAEWRVPVLISGETGTGKLLAAELLHECRALTGSFVRARCATLSGAEIERALEQASGGTLFLDEVADLPQASQQALAELLTSAPSGRTEGTGARARRANASVVASTCADLAARADAFEFSSDLLQLLRGIAIAMPSLRERRSDIPLLVDQFMRRHEGDEEPVEHAPGRIDSATMARLAAYHWPGNVAELKQFLARSGAGLVRHR
jgi:DNA-binding NtrC family response regulator